MKIALASARIVDRDISHNLSQMERYMKEGKAEGAELVCFGEAFLQGFNHGNQFSVTLYRHYH